MTIVSTSVETFEDANYAKITKKKTSNGWERVSTNENWDLFWSELDDFDGQHVVLKKHDGEVEIQEDDDGEYIEIEQEHSGLFADGEYTTRFRPIREKNTEDKPWMTDNGNDE